MSTISGTTINTGITLSTSGTYASPLTITATGAVEVAGYAAIYAPPSLAGTVVNQGSITGPKFAVRLRGGGYVDNVAGQIASGAYSGVYIGTAIGTVTNTGTIAGGSEGVRLNSGGVVNNNAGLIEGYDGIYVSFQAPGTVINSGTIIGTSSGNSFGVQLIGGGSLDNSGLISASNGFRGSPGMITNSGSIVGTSGYGIQLFAAATVVDSGTISGAIAAISFGGTGVNLLVLEPGYTIGGGVRGNASATNTVELQGTAGLGVTVDYNGLGLTNFQNVLFGAGVADTLKVSNNSGTLPVTIRGFNATSDTIDLTGIGTDGTITQNDTVAHRLTIVGSGGTLTLQLDPSDASIFTTVSDSANGTDLVVACFCRGTMILTDQGEVPVEALAIGDQVVTFSGTSRPIKWIGRRAYDPRFIAGNRTVLPIVIAAGALGDDLPARDLRLSPEHALYIDGILVPARYLVNGATIAQATEVDQLEYFHIELAGHDIIFADGATAETYVDCDNRGMFQNASEFAALHPNEVPATWAFCAPRIEWGCDELIAIRAALFDRSEALGHLLDTDPDLHLIVDGEIVRPDSVGAHVYRFHIAAGSAAVQLASRSSVPAEVEFASRDIRRLGVAVERIALNDGDLSIEAWHGHATLREGFHEDEAAHRWTDGMARLPETWLRPFPGPLTLDVYLASCELTYRLPAPGLTEAAARAQTG